MWSIHQGHPDGVNYNTRYPVANSVRDYFAQNIVRAIDVRVEALPGAGAKQPAFDAFAGIDLMVANRFQIKKTALGGVALLGHHDLHPDQFRLVAQHLDEASVRDEDETL